MTFARCCLAAIASIAIIAGSASATAITATDFSGSSSLGGGVFSFQDFLPTGIAGGTLFRDADLNGFSDTPQALSYNAPNFGIAGPVFLLYLGAGSTTAYHSGGALSGSFDWALTGYDDVVSPGDPLPNITGSPLFGTATFLGNKTVLHINEGLLWGDGLFAGGWAGYKLSGLTDLELTANAGGSFTITTVVPAPGTLAAFTGCLMIGSRRRRRA